MISAGKFFKAIAPSLSKKVFPFIKNWVTSLPFTLILPSLSTSKPGNCFNKFSTLESGRTLKELALNSNVSFFIRMGGASLFITTPANAFTFSNK